MPFDVKYDPDIQCVVTVLSGNLDNELVREFFKTVGQVASENQCIRVLSDLRQAKITAPTVHIYEMAKSIEKMNVLKNFRRAIVIASDHDDYAFWETACHNRGHMNIRLFEDIDTAKEWVLSN